MIQKSPRKRPEVNRQIVISILVIALSAVIAVEANSISPDQPLNSVQDSQKTSAASNLESKSVPSADVSAETLKDQKVPVEAEKNQVNKAPASSELKLSPKVDIDQAKEAASATVIAESDKQVVSSKDSDPAKSTDSELTKRKARAETAAAASASAPSEPAKQEASKQAEKKTESKLEPKASAAAKPVKQLAKNASKSKLPANLGTVTSTGSSGGHSYMSKHDAYSAIAEKHGALAQDAMKKSDKRQLQTGFSSIQKASGIGDMLSPFKGVTDSGLARSKYKIKQVELIGNKYN